MLRVSRLFLSCVKTFLGVKNSINHGWPFFILKADKFFSVQFFFPTRRLLPVKHASLGWSGRKIFYHDSDVGNNGADFSDLPSGTRKRNF